MKTLNLKVWDTPGGDNFANNRSIDYAHADVILLVYSIDKDSTLEALEEFIEDAKTYNEKEPKFFLVGNKVDLDAKGFRQVDRKTAKDWGKQNNVT